MFDRQRHHECRVVAVGYERIGCRHASSFCNRSPSAEGISGRVRGRGREGHVAEVFSADLLDHFVRQHAVRTDEAGECAGFQSVAHQGDAAGAVVSEQREVVGGRTQRRNFGAVGRFVRLGGLIGSHGAAHVGEGLHEDFCDGSVIVVVCIGHGDVGHAVGHGEFRQCHTLIGVRRCGPEHEVGAIFHGGDRRRRCGHGQCQDPCRDGYGFSLCDGCTRADRTDDGGHVVDVDQLGDSVDRCGRIAGRVSAHDVEGLPVSEHAATVVDVLCSQIDSRCDGCHQIRDRAGHRHWVTDVHVGGCGGCDQGRSRRHKDLFHFSLPLKPACCL